MNIGALLTKVSRIHGERLVIAICSSSCMTQLPR